MLKITRILLSVLVIGALAGSANAQTLFSADYSTTFPSFGYGFSFNGQGTPDCLVNIADDDGITTFDDAINNPHASVTADFSAWEIDPLACYTYAGLGVGAGHVLGFDDGAGGITYNQQFTSNDFSQYSVTLSLIHI